MNTSNLRILDFQNAVQQVLTPESDGGKDLSADSGFVSDRHPRPEGLIVLQGTYELLLKNRIYTLNPGDAVLIPPWCHHSYGYRSCDTGLLHLWIYFQPVCSGKCFQVDSGNWCICPELSFIVSKEWHVLFMERWQLWKQFGKKGEENEFFQKMLNLFLEEGLFYKKQKKSSGRDIVSETIALINDSNGRGCSLDFLAKQACCSKYHLVHLVQQRTGRTIGSFIEEARYIYVRSAEKQGLSQKEIAWNLGFSSAVSFWNWYHKRRMDCQSFAKRK